MRGQVRHQRSLQPARRFHHDQPWLHRCQSLAQLYVPRQIIAHRELLAFSHCDIQPRLRNVDTYTSIAHLSYPTLHAGSPQCPKQLFGHLKEIPRDDHAGDGLAKTGTWGRPVYRAGPTE
jgi:hypothetical protein